MPDREPDEVTGTTDEHEVEDQQEDFAALFEASEKSHDVRTTLDNKIEGTIVSIGEEWVFIDIGGKSEGVIAREELAGANRELPLEIGDKLTAYVVSTRGGEVLLSLKMTAAASEDAARDAHRSGIPVEGLVSGERKGGYTVSVFGKQAFCPYSQMDIQSGGSPESYIGHKFTFRVTEYSDRGRNIVLSRRDILEEERLKKVQQLKETLKPGDVVQGTVKKLAQFGAFVDIGGIEGLIPMSELAWYRVNRVEDVLHTGQVVTVKIMDLDWDRNRISLSLKQTLADPWDSVAERYIENTMLTGVVTKLMNFGAFVELEPGVEGLIHISNLGMGRRINHPREALAEGDRTTVRVISVDPESRRIGLELKHSVEGEAEPQTEIQEGDVLFGTVDAIKEYGVFVTLPGGRSGLLHVSEIGDSRTGDLRNRFPVGSEIEVQILGIDPESNKISLSTRSLLKRTEESQFKDFVSGKSRSSFGTLGDLLKEKIEEE
ncbi:MAG TPA: 30S ribosomal protein S1 [Desulfomonilaceae bacterium]|nr:30S ribosomal protein S1 [Desulfomonilaceae bacterium]